MPLVTDFGVQPANIGGATSEAIQGLVGLGQIRRAKAVQEQQKQILGQLSSAIQSGDSDAVFEIVSQNPQVADFAQKMGGVHDESQKQEKLQTAYQMMVGDPIAALEGSAQRIEGRGGDATQTRQMMQAISQNPEAAESMALSAFAMYGTPDQYKQFREISGGEAPSIGQYNPRDYTVESFSEFTKTGDPGVLQRYAPGRPVDIGGVPHTYDPVKGEYVPVTTAEAVAESKATIESAVTEARQLATLNAAKQVASQGQLGKLDDANFIYKGLKDADLDLIYGRGEAWYPEFFRSQRGIDLIADRDQLLGMLKLGARGELKGQGPITEGEQKILGDAVTTLSNPNISPEKARTSIDRAMQTLYRAAGEEFVPEGTVIRNTTTGEERVYQSGEWVKQ